MSKINDRFLEAYKLIDKYLIEERFEGEEKGVTAYINTKF